MKTFEQVKKRTEKREKNKNKKKWWIIKTENYTIPIYFLPFAIFIIPFDKLKNYIYNSMTWNEEKAKKVLDKMLPRILEWNKEENHYWCHIRKYGWWYSQKRIPFYYKKWTNKFSYELKKYLIEKYELEYYTKEVLDDYDWYLIIFTEKERRL